ncbi:unnamed protein product [Pedinophyceae sp. YPF-701]|nr:unnamed protein product [Pedinophyceae sp. YPF-701]
MSEQAFLAGQGHGHAQWYTGGYDSKQYQGYSGGMARGGSFSNLQDEPPLLEELGIDVQGIFRRAVAALQWNPSLAAMRELDMGGALLIVMAVGATQLLMAKLHFGVLLGWSVIAATAISWMARMVSGGSPNVLSVYSTLCLLGYCLMPMVVLSFVALVLPHGLLLHTIAALAAGWSAHAAALVHVGLSEGLAQHKWIIFYPYLCYFAIMALLACY